MNLIMKKVLFLTALIAATLHVDAQQVKYTVNGVCDNNGGTIILVNRLTREQIGTTVVADGKFSLSGTAEKDALMAIGDQSSDWATLFFNDGTPVSVNLNDSTLKGSPLNERLVAYDMAANAPIGSVQKQMSMMTEEEQERRE